MNLAGVMNNEPSKVKGGTAPQIPSGVKGKQAAVHSWGWDDSMGSAGLRDEQPDLHGRADVSGVYKAH
jgi:hypothetical protein